MIDVSLANEAISLLNVDREEDYGDMYQNHRRIATLWSGYLGHEVSPEDVAAMMVLLKIGRSKAKYKRDNVVDGIAYLLMMDLMRSENGSRR